MKRKFEPSELEIILMDDADIISTSPVTGEGNNPFVDGDANGDHIFNPGGWA